MQNEYISRSFCVALEFVRKQQLVKLVNAKHRKLHNGIIIISIIRRTQCFIYIVAGGEIDVKARMVSKEYNI